MLSELFANNVLAIYIFVYTSDACSSSGGGYTTEALAASAWTCLRCRSLCCTWTCLHNKRPELHLDFSTLKRTVLLLEVTTQQGPNVSLDVSTLQRLVLLLASS
jgi:hypothetical protein